MALDLTPAIVPADAERVHRGCWRWRVPGATVLCLAPQADPLKDTEAWLEEARAGMPTLEFQREYLLDFSVWTGKPVYPEYRDHLHRSPVPLAYVPIRPIHRGWDIPGPLACTWVQLVPAVRPGAPPGADGPLRCQVLAEAYADCGVAEFGRLVQAKSAELFPEARQYLDAADPAAWAHAGHDKRAASEVLRAECGIVLQPGATDLVSRLEGVRAWLTRLLPTAHPSEPAGALLLDPSCVMLRDGFKSGYHYAEVERAGRFKEVPEKNEYSHVMNALEYAITRLTPHAPTGLEAEVPPLEWDDWLGRLRR